MSELDCESEVKGDRCEGCEEMLHGTWATSGVQTEIVQLDVVTGREGNEKVRLTSILMYGGLMKLLVVESGKGPPACVALVRFVSLVNVGPVPFCVFVPFE